MSFNNTIQWYENKALDNPELRSPTPCPRGVFCQYKLPNSEEELELACCRMVHPGEEGNGRRLFPARTAADGRQQNACVRLTKAGFYERCRLKQPWRVWAEQHNIPLPPTDVPWEQVKRVPIQKKASVNYSKENKSLDDEQPSSSADWPSLENRASKSPFPPPPLNLSPLRSMNVGFNTYYDISTEGGFTPRLPCGTPASQSTIEELLALDTRLMAPQSWSGIVQAKTAEFRSKGASLTEAYDAAQAAVAAEIVTDSLCEEGAMDAVD